VSHSHLHEFTPRPAPQRPARLPAAGGLRPHTKELPCRPLACANHRLIESQKPRISLPTHKPAAVHRISGPPASGIACQAPVPGWRLSRTACDEDQFTTGPVRRAPQVIQVEAGRSQGIGDLLAPAETQGRVRGQGRPHPPQTQRSSEKTPGQRVWRTPRPTTGPCPPRELRRLTASSRNSRSSGWIRQPRRPMWPGHTLKRNSTAFRHR
jgi:hypothetical protein